MSPQGSTLTSMYLRVYNGLLAAAWCAAERLLEAAR